MKVKMKPLIKIKMKKYGCLAAVLAQLTFVSILCIIWLDPFPTVFNIPENGASLSLDHFSILIIGLGSSLLLLYKTYDLYTEYNRRIKKVEEREAKEAKKQLKQKQEEVIMKDGK